MRWFLWLLLILINSAFAQLCTGQLYSSRPNTELNRYTVCTVDLRQNQLRLFWKDANGEAFGSFERIAGALRANGRRLVFAMNAGMYHDDLRPVGLYVERSQALRRLVLTDGPGNFHLKPNGVFYWNGSSGGVMESGVFARVRPPAQYATQSGPMLVIDGRIHPRFNPQSDSRKIRNGVGMIDPHTAVFVVSENLVNFYDFALFFRDALKARNALYLDGTISSLYDPQSNRHDRLFALGPIVGVVR
jgi:uncharacterized protein YigE (DUF2233 family)